MNLTEEIKSELEKASKIASLADRGVTIAAVISGALRAVHQDPILVGGAAVEFYTKGGYSTADIDMVAEGGPDLMRVMHELGFEKIGKDFFHPKLGIYIEFPGRSLRPSEKYAEIRIGKHRLKIISVEDLIVDRLASFKFWKSAQDGVNALLLLEMVEVDIQRLDERAKQEEVWDGLRMVREVSQEVIRRKLSPHAANRLLEEKMRKLK